MLKSLGLVGAFCLCVFAAAQADTIRGRLEAFGFFGRWAADCASAASRANSVRDAFVTAEGTVAFTESLGEQYQPNGYVVLDATPLGSDKVLLDVRLNGETEQTLTIQRRHGRLRTIENRLKAGGKRLVANGVAVHGGGKTPWLSRCAEQP